MKRFFLIGIVLCCQFTLLLAQQTKVFGKITDAATGESLPFVRVQFKNTKIAVLSDSVGNYVIESYYASDSLQFIFAGYEKKTFAVKKEQSQQLNVKLGTFVSEVDEVVVRPPDELPSTTLHKKVIANKDINNKEKLLSYDYEVYNKMQLDINNIGEKFTERDFVKRLDLVMDYLDSTDNGKSYLPVLLSETVSNFYFKNKPKKKKEVIQGTKITGIENIQISQMLGDMYLDINVYENNIVLFQRSFISPVSNVARSFYRFYLEDSTFIGNNWCYKLRFVPKRSGELTFEGEMWIHDTTYAVRTFKAKISGSSNINFIEGLYFEQEFQQVEREVWMLVREKMIADIKLKEKTELYGFFARKLSSRKDFVINKPHEPEFYKAESTVELAEGATTRDEQFWKDRRHEALSDQEKGIENMIDSLNNTRVFKLMKGLTYMAATGYYPVNKIEYGSAYSFFSVNPVEKYRLGLAIRTSNKFSKRVEYGARVAYGFGDEQFKYGLSFRYNVTPKKRGVLTAFYNKDIEQIGISPTAASVGSTFATLFRTGPLDKLTFVTKTGVNFEKDVKKDIIVYLGVEWKEYEALGLANYQRLNVKGELENINKTQTAEITARFRWTKEEEFISGSFDRTSLRSKFPILSFQGIFGIKDVFGSDYNYQRLEFQMDHHRNIGYLGRIRYGVSAGYFFGSAAYPFLKVHEGNQSYWLLTSTFNKLNFFEFISDKYVSAYAEHHLEGLLTDRIPLIKKLQWRLVLTGRIAYGAIDDRHSSIMLLPSFTKKFGNVPYAEFALGVENIFKVGRIDLVWRLTHLDPGMNPLGIRARFNFGF